MRRKILLGLALFIATIIGGIVGAEMHGFAARSIGRSVSFSYLMIAGEALEKGDYLKGIAYLNRIIVLEPESETAYKDLARAYEKMNRFDLAIESYENLLRTPGIGDGERSRDVRERIERLKRDGGMNGPGSGK